MTDAPAQLRPPGPFSRFEFLVAGRYLRAIYAHIQAELAEVYRDIDTTPHNDSKAERMRERYEVKVDEHRRNLRWAIADLLGRPRTTVELI